ncbi:MAG: hypothetical protein KatS3mg099_336 [Candidatus Parcubacteria bacterium]|nr:MAG: hypothetical protein KatS3mg099_336 [Candidatus Parcubacteria bacterium]
MRERAPEGGLASLLHKGAAVVALLALANQAFALLRDRLLAGHFGAGGELDIYFAAFRFPDILFLLLSLGASAFITIPILAERKQEGGRESEMRYVSQWSFLLGAAGLIGAGVLAFGASWIAHIFFPGFLPAQQEELASLVRLLALQPGLLALAALWSAVAQWRRAFVLYGLAPIAYNLSIIAGIILLAPSFGIAGVVAGVVVGAVAQVALLGWWLWRRLHLSLWAGATLPPIKEVRQVLRLSVPRGVTLAVGHLLLLLVASVGAMFAQGSVAAFFFAFGLVSVPLALVVTPYVASVFPLLAQGAAEKNWEQFVEAVISATRQALWWVMFAMAAFIVLRAQIVRVVYGSGAFDWEDTRLTAAALAVLALSLPAQALILLFARSWYAMQRNFWPLLSALAGAVVGVAAGALLLFAAQTSPAFLSWFARAVRLEGIADTRIVLLAGAYSLGLVVQACVLLAPLVIRFRSIAVALADALWRAALAAFAASAAMYLTLHFLAPAVSLATFAGVLLHGAGAGIVGAVVYGGVSLLLGAREARTALQLAHFWRRG